MTSLLPIVQGYSLTLGLIAAIGAQNALLISQCIRNQHQWLMAGICMLIDIMLISAGVFGLGLVIENAPGLMMFFKLGGAAFLFWYGARSFMEMRVEQSLVADDQVVTARRTIILTTLAVSLLNPHVYLDTVILIGSVGAALPENHQWLFALGASLGSISWFISLCLLGKILQPVFANANAWKVLHGIVGVTMWAIASSLLYAAISA
ncbi:LysE/ArgO family amino acid transporter [Sessilibacter sp. MAH1]